MIKTEKTTTTNNDAKYYVPVTFNLHPLTASQTAKAIGTLLQNLSVDDLNLLAKAVQNPHLKQSAINYLKTVIQ